MSKTELKEALTDLVDALDKGGFKDAPEKLVQGAALQIESQMDLADRMLTDEARAVLAKVEKNLFVVENGKVVARAFFLARRVRNDQVGAGVGEICGMVNRLVSRGYAISTLAPISSLKLMRAPMEVETQVVLCYLHIKEEFFGSATLLAEELQIKDGQTPPMAGEQSLKIKLPDNQFMAVIRVTHMTTLMNNKLASLQQQLDEYLRVLPPGTKVIKMEQCPITDISISWEVTFENPLLEKIFEVRLNHVRQVTQVDGRLEQFNLFLGIDYYDRDGKKLFV